MKILLTGGAGFIGSHIADAYIAAGHQVTIIDDLSTGSKSNLNPQAKFIHLDINSDQIKEIFQTEKPDLLNHQAAQINVRTSVADPKFDAHTNIIGSINLLEAAKACGSVRHIIFASSGGAIYGDADTIPTPETYPAAPISPYGIAKFSVEKYLHYYHTIHSISYTSLRYANVYGPRQNPHGEAGVVAIFYHRAQQTSPLTINGSGDQTRDFVFVADVVAANLAASDSHSQGCFNIGTGIETSVTDLTKTILSTLPQPVPVNHAPAKEGEQQRSCLDPTLAQTQLNWHPQTDLAAGLRQTAEFFLST